jgi:hypothetical protein
MDWYSSEPTTSFAPTQISPRFSPPLPGTYKVQQTSSRLKYMESSSSVLPLQCMSTDSEVKYRRRSRSEMYEQEREARNNTTIVENELNYGQEAEDE